MQAIVIGIDLAWSPKNPTGLAVATVTDVEMNVLAATMNAFPFPAHH
jgi:predicted RNase H-like nuclease